MTDRPAMGMRAWGVLLVLCGAIFLEGTDAAMLNVALPAIRAELGLSTTELSAIVSAYVLGYAGFMLLGGRAADMFGRRRMFIAALVVFLAFSGLGGLANEGWTIILARFVTGVAAAFMTPAGLSLVTTNIPEGPQRDRAVLVYAATAAAGFSLGLVTGGLLAAINWRWVFFAPVLLGTLLLALAIPLIRDQHDRSVRVRFDFGGALSLTGAMLLAAYGVTRLEHPSEGLGWTLAIFAASGLLWLAFLAIERRVSQPLVRLAVFRTPGLVLTNLVALLFVGAFFGFQFLVSLYLQELLGWTSLQTGLAMLIVAIDAILAPTVTPILVRRWGHGPVIIGGLALAALAYGLFLRLGLDWSYAAMLPTMVLLGLAFSLTYGPLTIAATERARADEQGLASGLINTAFQFGAALGVSAVSAITVLALAGDGPEAQLEAIRLALLVPVGATVLALAIAATGLVRRPQAASA